MAKRSKKKKGSPGQSKETLPEKSSGFPWPMIAQAFVIAAATLWIYWPALHGGWLWDDNLYITANPLLNDPARWWKIWFVPGSQIDYYPIEQTLQWMQWQLWEKNTLGYHATNVLLHILSSLLVWRLLSKFGLRLAWLGGLLFAVHPVQVESVAWISEFKNTLSLPPFLLAMCAYMDYEENKKSRDYRLSLGWFLAAMLCKNSMALFPAVILLYAWWKRGRITRSDLRASAPFFIISVVLTLVTAWAGTRFVQIHSPTTEASTGATPDFLSHLALEGLVISFYFSKCFWPVGLLPIYPPWNVSAPLLVQFLPWLIFGVGFWWLWSKRRSWGRHALLGLGFFLISLLPVLGLIAVRYPNLTWSLDHLVYMPLLGLIGLTVAGLEQIYKLLPNFARPYSMAIAAVMVALLLLASHGYAGSFVSSEALWSYTLRYGPESWKVRLILGQALLNEGRFSEALEQDDQALQDHPDLAMVHDNIGDDLLEAGRYSEAANEFQEVLRINPNHARAHFNLARSQQKLGLIPEAIDQYREALRLHPAYPDAHHKLGDILLETGHPSEAIDEYEETVELNPGDYEAHNNLGGTLFKAGRYDEAIEHFAASLKINPNNATAHNNMGIALAKVGRIPEAIEQFEAALKIRPDFADARDNLAEFQALQNAASEKN